MEVQLPVLVESDEGNESYCLAVASDDDLDEWIEKMHAFGAKILDS